MQKVKVKWMCFEGVLYLRGPFTTFCVSTVWCHPFLMPLQCTDYGIAAPMHMRFFFCINVCCSAVHHYAWQCIVRFFFTILKWEIITFDVLQLFCKWVYSAFQWKWMETVAKCQCLLNSASYFCLAAIHGKASAAICTYPSTPCFNNCEWLC